MLRKSLKLTFLSSCSAAFFVAGCNAGNASSTAEAPLPDQAMPQDYVKTAKPGAAISFLYDSRDPASDFGPREVKLSVSDRYNSGQLRVEISPNENLSVAGGTGSFSFDMAGSNSHDIRVTVTPLTPGRHFLNFTAIADHGTGQTARSNFAVPIYAGVVPPKPGFEYVEDTQETTTPPGIIVMEAEETIITKAPDQND